MRDSKSEEHLRRIREADRLQAFKECARDAVTDVLHRPDPISIIYQDGHNDPAQSLEEPVYIRALHPGMTVRIWALQGLSKTWMHRLQSPSWTSPTYAQHLSVEILPSASPAVGETTSYSLGFAYGSDLRKPVASAAHFLSKEPGQIISPDINFIQKLVSQGRRPDLRERLKINS